MSDYPPKPIRGWMEKGPDFDQGWRGWKVYANPGEGRVPVTIVPGHADHPAPDEEADGE